MAATVEKETNFYLYKIIDKDELVYIGKSTNIDNRIEVNGRRKINLEIYSM